MSENKVTEILKSIASVKDVKGSRSVGMGGIPEGRIYPSTTFITESVELQLPGAFWDLLGKELEITITVNDIAEGE